VCVCVCMMLHPSVAAPVCACARDVECVPWGVQVFDSLEPLSALREQLSAASSDPRLPLGSCGLSALAPQPLFLVFTAFRCWLCSVPQRFARSLRTSKRWGCLSSGRPELQEWSCGSRLFPAAVL
jgi:hypothetical protein